MVRQKGLIIRCLSGAYGLRLGEQNDSRYPRNALSRTAHKSTEWVRWSGLVRKLYIATCVVQTYVQSTALM